MSNELTGYCDLHGEHTFPESLACQKCQRAHERHLVSEHIDANQRLEAENAELRRAISEASPKWIPLSERVPAEEGRYAILYRYKQTGIVKAFIGDFLGDGWSCDVRDSTITHWMPLPEAPK